MRSKRLWTGILIVCGAVLVLAGLLMMLLSPKQEALETASGMVRLDQSFFSVFESLSKEVSHWPSTSTGRGPASLDSGALAEKIRTYGLDTGGTVYTFENASTSPKADANFCYQVGSGDGCKNKSRLIEGLRTARYYYNFPPRMTVGEEYDFGLVIDPHNQVDSAGDVGPGEVRQGDTRISLTMEADLAGSTFKIEPEGRQQRELSLLAPTRWSWNIKPLLGGEHPLQLSLYVMLLDGDGNKVAEDTSLAERRTVVVDVAWIDQATAFVKKAEPIHGFLVSVAGSISVLLGWLGWRRSKDDE